MLWPHGFILFSATLNFFIRRDDYLQFKITIHDTFFRCQSTRNPNFE